MRIDEEEEVSRGREGTTAERRDLTSNLVRINRNAWGRSPGKYGAGPFSPVSTDATTKENKPAGTSFQRKLNLRRLHGRKSVLHRLQADPLITLTFIYIMATHI